MNPNIIGIILDAVAIIDIWVRLALAFPLMCAAWLFLKAGHTFTAWSDRITGFRDM